MRWLFPVPYFIIGESESQNFCSSARPTLRPTSDGCGQREIVKWIARPKKAGPSIISSHPILKS